MRAPCDELLARSKTSETPCQPAAGKWVLAAAILGSSMAFIDGTVVNVALPAIQTSFNATAVSLQWVVEAYGLLLSALILAGGSLGDKLGRRKIFLIGVAVFACASLVCGLSASIEQLIVARSVQGFGAALLVPGSLAIISAAFDEKSRGSAIGTWSGFTAITTAIGPVLGGWLVQYASWRWAFFINLPLAVAVLIISLKWIPESRGDRTGRIDWPGVLLVTFGLAGVVTGFIESSSVGWKHPLVLGSLVGGLACLVVLGWIERRVASPIVPLTLFASATFSGANLLTLFLYAAIGIFFFLFPLDLIQVQGYSPTHAGAAMLPLILLMFALSRWSGRLVARYGARLPLIFGPLIAAVGFTLFALPSTGESYWKSFFPAILVLGFGMAVTVAPLTTVVMNTAGQDRAGAASGINNAVARVAGVLAIAVLGSVMINAFGSRLDKRLATVNLPPDVRQSILAAKTKLAGLEVPASLDTNQQALVRKAIDDAFVSGFKLIQFTCAALAVIGAGVVFWSVPKRVAAPAASNRTRA